MKLDKNKQIKFIEIVPKLLRHKNKVDYAELSISLLGDDSYSAKTVKLYMNNIKHHKFIPKFNRLIFIKNPKRVEPYYSNVIDNIYTCSFEFENRIKDKSKILNPSSLISGELSNLGTFIITMKWWLQAFEIPDHVLVPDFKMSEDFYDNIFSSFDALLLEATQPYLLLYLQLKNNI